MKRLSPFLFLMFFSSNAWADLYIEPYLGYHQTSSSFNPGGLIGNLSGKTSGLGYGVRLGGTYYQFQFGLDYVMAPGSWSSDSNNAVGRSGSVRADHMGLFAGWRSITNFRIFLSYYFFSQVDYEFDGGSFFFIDQGTGPTNRANSRSSSFLGSGYRLGVGYIFATYVSANLEYFMLDYENFGSVDLTQSGAPAYDANMIMLSVSFPFTLFGTSSFSSGSDFSTDF